MTRIIYDHACNQLGYCNLIEMFNIHLYLLEANTMCFKLGTIFQLGRRD